MICEKCCKKMKYLSARTNGVDEVYRRYKCFNCDKTVYTVEYEVEQTPEFMKEWDEALKK